MNQSIDTSLKILTVDILICKTKFLHMFYFVFPSSFQFKYCYLYIHRIDINYFKTRQGNTVVFYSIISLNLIVFRFVPAGRPFSKDGHYTRVCTKFGLNRFVALFEDNMHALSSHKYHIKIFT